MAVGGKPGKSADESKSSVEKRTFGVTGGRGVNKLPPLKKALPMSIQQIVSEASNAICNVAVTPGCIMSMSSDFSIDMT